MERLLSFIVNVPHIIFHPVFLIVTAAWFAAQLMKVLLHFQRTHRINWKLLIQTGGMPSSHSAYMSALSTYLGLWQGWGSPIFFLSLGLSIIIMHDAAGLRAAAGRQAVMLNQVAARLYESRKAKPPRMKEQLGHSVPEVLGGALLGLIVALLLYPGN
jgi:uncharacterized protein